VWHKKESVSMYEEKERERAREKERERESARARERERESEREREREGEREREIIRNEGCGLIVETGDAVRASRGRQQRFGKKNSRRHPCQWRRRSNKEAGDQERGEGSLGGGDTKSTKMLIENKFRARAYI